MGIIKGIIFMVLNLAVFLILITVVRLALEKFGVFRFLEGLFGKRNDYQVKFNEYEEKHTDKENVAEAEYTEFVENFDDD